MLVCNTEYLSFNYVFESLLTLKRTGTIIRLNTLICKLFEERRVNNAGAGEREPVKNGGLNLREHVIQAAEREGKYQVVRH